MKETNWETKAVNIDGSELLEKLGIEKGWKIESMSYGAIMGN